MRLHEESAVTGSALHSHGTISGVGVIQADIENFGTITPGLSTGGVAAFSSSFRARVKRLAPPLATQVQRVYDQMRRHARAGDLASTYLDALPSEPNKPDHTRHDTYQRLLARVRGEKPPNRTCGGTGPGPRRRTGC